MLQLSAFCVYFSGCCGLGLQSIFVAFPGHTFLHFASLGYLLTNVDDSGWNIYI